MSKLPYADVIPFGRSQVCVSALNNTMHLYTIESRLVGYASCTWLYTWSFYNTYNYKYKLNNYKYIIKILNMKSLYFVSSEVNYK